MWVRGLKYRVLFWLSILPCVAPRVGAWIEILKLILCVIAVSLVAPRVGAWIEIANTLKSFIDTLWSHPVWVRGLKFAQEVI